MLLVCASAYRKREEVGGKTWTKGAFSLKDYMIFVMELMSKKNI